jgi:hypothetical protein
MTLSFKFLGFEIATIELALPESTDVRLTPVDRGVKGLSRWWVKGMVR